MAPAPINQLADPTTDGLPDNNAREDCVPASIAWALEDLTGGTFNADEIKDAVYGPGYTGPTDASHYIDYCRQHGVTLSRVTLYDQAALVAALHRIVGSDNSDALVTIPSQWGTPFPLAQLQNPNFSTHVCCAAFDLGSTGMRLMNPWGGIMQDWTDARLEQELCYATVWQIQKATPATTGAAPMPGIPTGWTDDGTSLKAPNGHTVTQGFRAWVRSHPWDPTNVPLDEAAGVDSVLVEDGRWGKGTRQIFESSVLFWAEQPDRSLNAPAGTIGEVPAGREFAWVVANPPTPKAAPAPAPVIQIQKPDLSGPIGQLKTALQTLESETA